jgi:hypothetical protein
MRGVWYVGFVRGFCVDAMVRSQRGVFASVFASIGRCAVPDSWTSVCAPWMERHLCLVALPFVMASASHLPPAVQLCWKKFVKYLLDML